MTPEQFRAKAHEWLRASACAVCGEKSGAMVHDGRVTGAHPFAARDEGAELSAIRERDAKADLAVIPNPHWRQTIEDRRTLLCMVDELTEELRLDRVQRERSIVEIAELTRALDVQRAVLDECRNERDGLRAKLGELIEALAKAHNLWSLDTKEIQDLKAKLDAAEQLITTIFDQQSEMGKELIHSDMAERAAVKRAETAQTRVYELETLGARILGKGWWLCLGIPEKHAPDCNNRCHGKYVCMKCHSVCGWCYGASDEHFEFCDDCAAAEFSKEKTSGA